MRKYIMPLLLLSFLLWSGCKPKHPSMITVDPGFNPNEFGSVLVAPFISSVTEGEDPERESENVMNRIIWEMLSNRSDYKFLSPEQFRIAVGTSELGEKFEAFKINWIKNHEIDKEFMKGLRNALNFDLLLMPSVHMWYKDEADYRETATASSTQVGATLTLVDPESCMILWEATDENYKESVRTEGSRVQVETGGMHRRVSGRTVTGRDMFAAPPYEDVAVMVLEVLVSALPSKGMTKW